MLNSFWYTPKSNVFTNYYFIHDTTGTIPNMYRYVVGDVYSTKNGIYFNNSSILTDDSIRVNLADCSIEYTINCASTLSGTIVGMSDDFRMHPTPTGQLLVFDQVYCQPGTLDTGTKYTLKYIASNGQFFVLLNDVVVIGPRPVPNVSVGARNRSLLISANDTYIDYFRVLGSFNMIGTATSAITKRIITPYTDNASSDPDGFREGILSYPNNTSWTGWINMKGFSNLYIASPNGNMVFAAGTTDGTSSQIIGRCDGSPVPSRFQFSRVSNTHVPISIHAYGLSGYTVRLDDTTPIKWGYIQPVQFPEKFKIVQLSNGQTLKFNGVDLILQSNTFNTQYETRLRDVTTDKFLKSNPISLVTDVYASSLWTFTSDTITSSDGYSIFGYRFA